MILKLARKIKYFIKKYMKYREYEKYIKSDSKHYILVWTPTHDNIGDQAISIAERTFFKDNEIPIFEIQDLYCKTLIPHIAKTIKKGDIIFIHGGGYLGTEYFWSENIVRSIIQAIPNNKIIIMPQTVFYKNDEFSKKEFENSKEIYNKHKNLYICAREKVSYDIMKKSYPNAKVILTPDIVLYLNETIEQTRYGILFAVRNDVEKQITKEEIDKTISVAKELDSNVTITDMVRLKKISINEREKVFQSKLNEFRNSKLVVTDRLHGMIFAAITSTPCIVFGNYNHKIKSSYDWIKELNYISYMEDTKNIKEEMQKLLKLKNVKFDNEKFKKYYNQILDCIYES